jgi:3-deoxy-manno-octulosonate cytidylyltransferase (CMP-KDO synthetase)
VALPEGELERIERLEQLRPLAAGLRIGVAVVDGAEAGVDTPADARRAERRLLQNPVPGVAILS